MKKLTVPLSNSLSSSNCLCCSKPVFFTPLCFSCIENFVFTFDAPGQERCERCGKMLISEMRICLSCREKTKMPNVDYVFPLFSYRLWRKDLLFEWKMNGQRTLSPVFAEACSRALSLLYKQKENVVIVPVPPRPGKIRKVGWDQVDELCSFIKNRHGYSVKKFLCRYSKEQQKKKSLEERHSCKNAYGLSKYFFNYIEKYALPKEVVLVDDVITSGATVNECAGILKSVGIGKVQVLSLFIVD